MAPRLPLVIGTDGLAQQLQSSDSLPALGYTSGSNANGTWRQRPDGQIEQSGTVTLSSGTATITFPIAFPTACEWLGLTPRTTTTGAQDPSAYQTAAPGKTTANIGGSLTTVGIGAVVGAGTFTVAWHAIGI